jgi:hypothetical protein
MEERLVESFGITKESLFVSGKNLMKLPVPLKF